MVMIIHASITSLSGVNVCDITDTHGPCGPTGLNLTVYGERVRTKSIKSFMGESVLL